MQVVKNVLLSRQNASLSNAQRVLDDSQGILSMQAAAISCAYWMTYSINGDIN